MKLLQARPMPFDLPQGKTALIMIDMQRDFVEKGGYGYLQCNSDRIFDQVTRIIEPCKQVLTAARTLGMTVIHTREGHASDLRDLPASKKYRQYQANAKNYPLLIGDNGPMGRLLVRGEYGHDIIDALKPLNHEIVIDKPGKGTFYNTDIHQILVSRGITHLLLCGVTTECCVATTFREANDRGFDCCTLVDCTNGFNENIVTETLNTFCAYDGLLGSVGTGKELVELSNANEFQMAKSSVNIFKSSSRETTIPFMTKSINKDSNLIQSIIRKGGQHLGEIGEISLDKCSFILAVDSGNIENEFVLFTVSSGMVSLHNSDHSLYSSICIITKTIEEARCIFANERGFDEEDELSKMFYEYPTKHIDYNRPNIQFSSKSTTPKGKAVPFDWELFESVYDYKYLMESGYRESDFRQLLMKRRKILNLFQPASAPKVLIVKKSTKYSVICRLLGLPCILVKGDLLIGEFGLDGNLLDIAEEIYR